MHCNTLSAMCTQRLQLEGLREAPVHPGRCRWCCRWCCCCCCCAPPFSLPPQLPPWFPLLQLGHFDSPLAFSVGNSLCAFSRNRCAFSGCSLVSAAVAMSMHRSASSLFTSIAAAAADQRSGSKYRRLLMPSCGCCRSRRPVTWSRQSRDAAAGVWSRWKYVRARLRDVMTASAPCAASSLH